MIMRGLVSRHWDVLWTLDTGLRQNATLSRQRVSYSILRNEAEYFKSWAAIGIRDCPDYYSPIAEGVSGSVEPGAYGGKYLVLANVVQDQPSRILQHVPNLAQFFRAG